MNYAQFFHHTESERSVEGEARFFKSANFDDRIAAVTRRVEEISIQRPQTQ